MSARVTGWMPAPGNGAVKVPQNFEYRYCSKDINHWRVEGETCPVCQSKIVVLIYKPAEVRG